MFIWDFVADTVLGQIFDWVYGKIVEFLGEFFSMMNGILSLLRMGALWCGPRGRRV